MTFPRPFSSEHYNVMNTVGESYYDWRMAWMAANDEGLTKTYNRFHDPHEQSSEILHLRELHAAMDRAVLEAYGWHDLAQTARCEFLLDYEEEDEEGGSSELSGGSKRGKKKPWRLRWPDDFRDEVLARLLELNEQRHKEELLAGKAVSSAKRSSDDEDSDSSDDDADEDAPTKTKTTGKPRKSKRFPAAGQQEMEF